MTAYDPSNWYWQFTDKKIYSSTEQLLIDEKNEKYALWISKGNQPTPISSMDELVLVLRAANVPPYHLVPSRLIVDRLHAAGKLEAANAALEAADLYTRQRWNTRAEIYADDPTAVGLLKAIGVSPEDILSPEA